MKSIIAVALLVLVQACATSTSRDKPFTQGWAAGREREDALKAREDYIEHGRFGLLDELEERAGVILGKDGKPKLKLGNENASAKVKLGAQNAGVGVNLSWKHRKRAYTPEQAADAHAYVPKPPRVPMVAEAAKRREE